MEVNDGLLAFGAEEEGAVGGVVHEEVFGEDGGAGGVAEEVEVGFLVGVGVGVVGAEAVAGEVSLGGSVEGGGEGTRKGCCHQARGRAHRRGHGHPRRLRGQERSTQRSGPEVFLPLLLCQLQHRREVRHHAGRGDVERCCGRRRALVFLPGLRTKTKIIPAFFSGGRIFLCPDGRMAWKFRGNFSELVNFCPPRNGHLGRLGYRER